MILLPKEWDLIVRALNTLIKKIDDSKSDFYDATRFTQIQEIKTLIERIELGRKHANA